MPSGTRSKSQNNRQRWREQNKEDIVYFMEVAWNIEPDETFYKIFNKFILQFVPVQHKFYIFACS